MDQITTYQHEITPIVFVDKDVMAKHIENLIKTIPSNSEITKITLNITTKC